ncbi:MAG: TAT-variant-translocated molybdopterin oxidoreductase [Bacteroidia bacterium]
MGTTKSYWKGVEEKLETPEFAKQRDNEFAQELPVEEFLGNSKISQFTTDRRDFLKFLGFSVAAATLASCESPVVKAIPYTNKPEEITPGVANWYASSYYDGSDYAAILVKTREGRPIYIKGNKDRGVNKSGINPRIAASVLSLYNGARLKQPMVDGSNASWSDVDATVKAELTKITTSGGAIRILTNTIISPSTQTAIADFMTAFGGTVAEDGTTSGEVKHIMYDAVSASAIRKANKASFGKAVIPSYNFHKADVIVSLDADFLTSWLMSTQYSVDYASRRNPETGTMSQHFQFETIMSTTGANADYRSAVKPSQVGLVAAAILSKLQGKSASVEGADENIDRAVKALKSAKGASLVVAGANDENIQNIVNAINVELGNYGKTIDLDNNINLKQGDDTQVETLVKEIEGGKVAALLMYGVNPAYSLPNGKAFAEALSKVKLSVAFSEYADETASKCKVVCAENHALESWNDYNPVVGHYAIAQPVIRPLFDTRQMQESLLVWAGKAERPSSKDNTLYHDYIKKNWEVYGFPTQTTFTAFTDYWHANVHNGYATMPPVAATELTFTDNSAQAIASVKKTESGDWEYVLYQKSSIGDGSQAANPWLQEMPDPITKVTWDNYITISMSDAAEMFNISDMADLYIGQQYPARVAKVTVNDVDMALPVYPLPGQAKGTIGIALGYGRAENGENIGKAAFQTGEYGGYGEKLTPIGQNAFRLTSFNKGSISYSGVATVEATSETYALACTQTHHTVMGRTSVVKETTLATYLSSSREAYNKPYTLPVHENGTTINKPISEIGLWDEHPVEHVGHRWGMTVDLNLCNGCGTCLIACQVENNVPVVGKDEVRRSREMHWLRLDRYFSSDTTKENGKDLGTISMYRKMEISSENPEVVFMPMMCQHCNHAPCETVCPVVATTHSDEGLNQMTYNRCIGTRYCANNCPYKVRRFNWFNYMGYKKFSEVNPSQDDLGRMVLNPDVTVRSRGVMEKCSMCVQKIQEGKLTAKKEGRLVKDGDATTACTEACPANAITFGDWNDKESALRKSADSSRAYQALEEVGVKPNIWYKVKVRNKVGEAVDHAHNNHSEQH